MRKIPVVAASLVVLALIVLMYSPEMSNTAVRSALLVSSDNPDLLFRFPGAYAGESWRTLINGFALCLLVFSIVWLPCQIHRTPSVEKEFIYDQPYQPPPVQGMYPGQVSQIPPGAIPANPDGSLPPGYQ